MSPLLLSDCSSDDESALAYYASVLDSIGASAIEVQLNIDGKGKGLVATKNIKEGDTVFVEHPLVSLQHADNEGCALVCRRCLRFVGSIERQIGHKLRCLVDRLRGAQHGSEPQNGVSEAENAEEAEVDLDGALEAGERLEQIYSHVTPERIEGLCSGAVTLPLSEEFKLPQSVACRRGCGALYCSTACEQAAWEHSHCLLCTAPGPTAPASAAAGPGPSTSSRCCPDPGSGASTSHDPSPAFGAEGSSASQPSSRGEEAASASPGAETSSSALGKAEEPPPSAPAAAAAGPSSASSAEATGPPASSSAAPGPSSASAPEVPEEGLYGINVDRGALAAFVDHARSTNEIFLLAAQVVAATWLRAARLLAERTPLPQPAAQAADAASGSAAAGGGDEAAAACRAALVEAWRPYMYGWKRCWWEAVAVPDDVDDEEEFRGQLRGLASDSLELLSAAISDPRFGPELLQLEVYGSIVGMFELNNLGLTVCSPVEDYFLAVDEMEDEDDDKRAVAKVTQPLLDALDAEYATPCEATAFMALQSCINHSCDPNCTADCDTGDSTVTVLAQRDIAAGEEVTLSYIDVSLPYKERQVELRDYGFVCRCPRCVAEAAAARAKRQGAAKGVKVGRRR